MYIYTYTRMYNFLWIISFVRWHVKFKNDYSKNVNKDASTFIFYYSETPKLSINMVRSLSRY
jgi:hypothetical protein